MAGLIGKKIGMTRIFDDQGAAVAVTVIEAGPCSVVQVKTEETDGYAAVQLGFGAKKAKRTSRAEAGHAAKAGLEAAPRLLREFKMELPEFTPVVQEAVEEPAEEPVEDAETQVEASEDADAPTDGEEEAGEGEGAGVAEEDLEAEGEEIAEEELEGEPEAEELVAEGEEPEVSGSVQYMTVEQFEAGDSVKVTGTSKGRGFQGVVKRYGFAGRPASHGHPLSRTPGSMGPGTDPSRVIKGKKLPGRMGGARTTISNLEVVKVDPERNLLFVKGGVPGARNSYVLITK